MNSRTVACVLGVALIMGAASAQTTQAVEWKVSEGGNGHWYQLSIDSLTWPEAKVACEARGGHLVTINTAGEQTFIRSVLTTLAWIGGFQQPDSCEPGCGWTWVTGEAWSYTNWWWPSPNDNRVNGNEDRLVFRGNDGTWDDVASLPGSGVRYGIEWDADCNNDGIVDYGQILSGELQDDNQNGVPDICEYTVTGVIPVSGPSSGGTSVIINGTNFPENPTVLIGGVPATDVVRVSPTRITATTPAGLPGMTSVTVGNWVQPNAFYYRPECGSDLDQNGSVDAGDIAIILLDFGPCYSTVAPVTPEDSRPFMLREEAAPAVLQSR